MQKQKVIPTITALLTKNNFEIKEVEKNKIIMALKKGMPRIYLETSKAGIRIKSFKELNDKAITETENVIALANQLNQETVVCKYYVQRDNKFVAEATYLTINTEEDLKKVELALKHDLKIILQKNKQAKKYLMM